MWPLQVDKKRIKEETKRALQYLEFRLQGSSNPKHLHVLFMKDLIQEATTWKLKEFTVSTMLQGVMKDYGGSKLIESSEVKAYLMKEDETATQTSGDDRVVVYLQKGIQEPVKTEVSKRQLGRSVIESSTPHDETQKPVDSKKEDESVEHVDVMDYTQPHRKPPIHNEKS
ncbi:uncharacterized protein LOC119987527 [Tripterygium wilfordii]|uniref:uncharacterized protein LOC119987527 n=1 Tax=Tripterygium wilfordii TaxID=458696 RepID=UPI0018F82506|nr:uncharacterized protein LOC119987527 [Tripterygium wilfordii]